MGERGYILAAESVSTFAPTSLKHPCCLVRGVIRSKMPAFLELRQGRVSFLKFRENYLLSRGMGATFDFTPVGIGLLQGFIGAQIIS